MRPLFSSLYKQASMDHLYVAGRALKESFIGGGGLRGLADAFSTPLSNVAKSVKANGVVGNLLNAGFMAPGLYMSATDPDMGPAQRAGKILGIVAPAYVTGHAAVGSKAPGFLGSEILGGGMLVHKGVVEGLGEQVDHLIGTAKPKMPQ